MTTRKGAIESYVLHVQSNLYIKGTGPLKCVLYNQLPLIYRIKLYALFITRRKRNCPLWTAICYIQVPYKSDLTVYEGYII